MTDVVDADHLRLERIAGKLAAARAMPVPPEAFGVEAHGFKLGAPVSEAMVAEFEERHEVTLPPAYRLFLTELSNGGAGPGYGLSRLAPSCCTYRRSGHLAQPSPYLPGPGYHGDWVRRYEDPPGPDRTFLPGTLEVATHGCSFATRLIVTGPARGRLFNVDYDGWNGLYVVEDADFLAWYERWLDEAVAGYDVGLFGERLPLDEPGLIAVLTGDPSPERRARAGESLPRLPEMSDSAWTALAAAMTTDVDATVRAGMWNLLRWNEHGYRRRLDDAEAAAEDIERYARSRTPPDLRALWALRRLTLADVLPELAGPDLERRRWTAHRLARFPWDFRAPELPDDVVRGLLGDPDTFLRSYGVELVGSYGLTHLHPLLRDLQATETDPWVRYHLGECLAERPAFTPAVQGSVDEPPF